MELAVGEWSSALSLHMHLNKLEGAGISTKHTPKRASTRLARGNLGQALPGTEGGVRSNQID
jgi:hypothetical protein